MSAAERWDPKSYTDTSRGHYGINWYGNPKAAGQREVAFNMSLKTSNGAYVAHRLYSGQVRA